MVETIQFLMCLSSKKTGKDLKVNGWTTWYDIDELNSCSFIPFKVKIFHSILKSSHYAPQCHSRPNYFTQHDFIWCKFLMKQIFAFYWASVVSSFPQLYFNQNFRNRHLLFLSFFFCAYIANIRFYCSAHIIIATPGRLEDMFQRRQEGCDLAASVKSLVSYCFLKLIVIRFANRSRNFHMFQDEKYTISLFYTGSSGIRWSG